MLLVLHGEFYKSSSTTLKRTLFVPHTNAGEPVETGTHR